MKHIFYIALAALLLTACSATKNLTQTDTPQAEAVSARIGMDLTETDLSCTGRLRMLRDDVVQLNLVFLGMNIGTLEFTPDTVLLVDRVNKQYVRARYQDIYAFEERNMDFRALQALFWGDNISGRDDGQLTWRYTAIGRVNKHKIPSAHEVRFKSGATSAGFDMRLNEITGDRKWKTRTHIDETKFTRRDPNILFKALLSM